MPVEVDYPVMSVDRIEEYADENTIGELTKIHVQAELSDVPYSGCVWQPESYSHLEQLLEAFVLLTPHGRATVACLKGLCTQGRKSASQQDHK